MAWTGSSPLAVVRDGAWGLLMFAGVVWLAVAWSVLRLQPADVVQVAGPVILFGALAEALRASAGARTWWINAGMAALFAVTGMVLLAEADTSYTTPAALAGWYLMVRGAVDVAVAMMTRATDRTWGLLTVVGVLEIGLGFFAASPFARTADLVVVVLGGLGVLRAVADLTTGLRLREARAAQAGVLDLPPERAAGVAGYSAGLADYDPRPARSAPRHRASPRSSSADAGAAPAGGSFHEEVLRTTADLDAMLALAGVTGTGGTGGAARLPAYDGPEVPDTPEGAELPEAPAAGATAAEAPAATDTQKPASQGAAQSGGPDARTDPTAAGRRTD